MTQRYITAGVIFSVLILICCCGLEYSKAEVIKGGALAESEAQPEMQWSWGEVVSVDVQKKEIIVKYLDYEADQEKEMTISIDEKTTFENVKSLEELKPQDTISIDYFSNSDGKNLARNVSVERPEEPLLPLEDISTPGTK